MEAVSNPAAPPPSTSDGPEPEKVRMTKPGLKRFALTLTVLFSFLLGIPFLLKSVEIYRSPLPFREIDDFASAIELNPVRFPCRFRAVFVNFPGSSLNADGLKLSIQDSMRKLTVTGSHSCGSCSCDSTVYVTLESNTDCSSTIDGDLDLKCGALSELKEHDFSTGKYEELFDEHLHSLLKESSSGGKVYTVFIVRKEENEVQAAVGKYRHAWIVGRVSEADAVKKVAEIFVKAFVNGGREEGAIGGEFMPVGSDGKIVLSFNLLNSDPHDWVYDWNFQKIDDHFLAPVVEALKPVADITVESQILYHTPKSSFSYWDDKLGSYVFHTNDLPFFVNSNEWHLDTSTAAGGRSKVLHSVVYVPSAAECPLLLQLPNGEISSTNGFISPMWGSVIVWNPSACSKDSEMVHNLRRNIPTEELTKILEVSIGQLRQLFGLKSEGILRHASGIVRLLTSEKGFTEWELDVLSREHTSFNLNQCGTTLGSLSRLVQSLPRMIIKDEIGKQVKYSLEAANSALRNAARGDCNASVVSSRQARSLAEDSFYHHSMMSVSYYSFEHCFAVYSPFFLPVALHVLLAVLREWKRYRQEMKKYHSWKKMKRD